MTPQKKQTSFEFPRKTIHALSLLVPFAAAKSLPYTQGVILFFIAIYIVFEWLKLKKNIVSLHRFTRIFQRENERTSFARAPLFLMVGVLVAITFFPPEASILGIYQAGF